jgi:hypothetical protein
LQPIIPGKVNVLKPAEITKARVCWDGTIKVNWWETTMNEVSPTDMEAIITF